MSTHPTAPASRTPDDPGPSIFTVDASRVRELPAASVVARIPEGIECLLVLAEEGAAEWGAPALELLASEISGSGRRVVVADFDVGAPKLHRHLGTRAGRGLSDVLAHRCRFSDVAQPVTGSGFWFMPPGEYPLGPEEMVDSGWWDGLLKSLREAGATLLLYRSDPLDEPAAVAERIPGTIVLTEETEGRRLPGSVLAVVVGRHPPPPAVDDRRRGAGGGLPAVRELTEGYRMALEALSEDAREARSSQRELTGALVRLSETLAELAKEARRSGGRPAPGRRPPARETPSLPGTGRGRPRAPDVRRGERPEGTGEPEAGGGVPPDGPRSGPGEESGSAGAAPRGDDELPGPAGGAPAEREGAGAAGEGAVAGPRDDGAADDHDADDHDADDHDEYGQDGYGYDAYDEAPAASDRELRRMENLLDRERALVEQLRSRGLDLERRVARAEAILDELDRQKPGFREKLEKKLKWRKRHKAWD